MVYIQGIVSGIAFLLIGALLIYKSESVARIILMIYTVDETSPNIVANWLTKGIGGFFALLGVLILWASVQTI